MWLARFTAVTYLEAIKQMTQTSPPKTDYKPQDDEINLFEFFETLWTNKVFIGLVTLVFTLAGLAYATYKSGQPDTYTAKAVLEVGSYIASTGAIVTLEAGGDLVQVISHTAGVKAQLLKGSSRLVELEATHLQLDQANQSLIGAVDFIVKRHQAVGQKIGQDRIIRPTAMMGAIKVQKQSPSDKKTAILVISTLLGLIVASNTIFFWKSYIQHKQRAEARVMKAE